MGAARDLSLDAPTVVLSGLVGGEKARGEDGIIATRRGWRPLCGEARECSGGDELSTTISKVEPAMLRAGRILRRARAPG